MGNHQSMLWHPECVLQIVKCAEFGASVVRWQKAGSGQSLVLRDNIASATGDKKAQKKCEKAARHE
jgi:hypothetical protein